MKRLLRSINVQLRSPVNPGISDNVNELNPKIAHMINQNNTQICVLDHYVKSVPNPQNALDIFKGEWASKFPKPYDYLEAGSSQLFEDPRIPWAVLQFGGVNGKTILELGPLEGGHTYMLECLDAASILSIESNTRAYLKCLVVKEILGLKRAHFMCGDFVEYLKNTNNKFDVVIASGVLYHMKNPVELIALLSKVTDKMFIWTHYYDQVIISHSSLIPDNKFGDCIPFSYCGFQHKLYRYEYDKALNWMGFCGGNDVFSNWMTRDDIIACCDYFGFDDIRVGFDDPQHPNGPAFALSAIRQ